MSKLNVNGQLREFVAEDDTPLLWVLREQLGLTGTKYGCGVAQCGACTVHIDGVPTRSCVRPLSSLSANEKIVTIEGLSPDGSHPVQKAWAALDVPQCGYCQCGMIMAARPCSSPTPNRATRRSTRPSPTYALRNLQPHPGRDQGRGPGWRHPKRGAGDPPCRREHDMNSP